MFGFSSDGAHSVASAIQDVMRETGVPIAFGVLVLRLLLQIWGYGRALVLGLENPVAVPLNLSVAEQARAEAEMLERTD